MKIPFAIAPIRPVRTRCWQWLRGIVVSGVLALTATTRLAAQTSPQDHVVIILDASGSMAGRFQSETPLDRMTAAKQALLKVAQKISTNTQIGLLVFSDPHLKSDWVYPLGPMDFRRLRDAILLPQPGAGTPLGAYLKKGADRLLEARDEQHGYGTYRLIVVTDGEAQDGDLVERYTPEINRRGLILDVIGVAMSQQHTLARLAHSYRAANDARALDRALSAVFAEIGGNNETGRMTPADYELLRPFPIPVAAAAVDALSESLTGPLGHPASPVTNRPPVRQP